MSETDRFDSMLLTIAQSQRGIEPLLDTVFSFLRRKTDFFTGAEPKVIEDTILKSVRKQAVLAEKDQFQKKQQEAEKRQKQEAARKAAELEKKQKKEENAPRFEEIPDDDETESKENRPEQMPPQKTSTAEKEDEEEDDNGPPLVGNGGQTDKYVWTQTLQEAQVNFAVPEGTKSRQVDVEIRAGKLRVGLRGGETFVDGPLYKKVKVDDSFWTLEDSNRICIYLQKDNQMEWWKTIIQGDAEIDTQKVQPENSKLDDLDSDTRQTVEKMMFDQRQKAMGLPTSDDMQKQEVLQKFMAQHPEMDFSKAKIN
ncbi:Nuclear migration protein nudC [Phytophthora palmivora]|uniref:Nuclear migration protein nudC n=1 Tax=Phytophthora palmivora TaxID=4796 RepID=A0A2P4YPY9_9STRA|nr:Nuclear migration protein nudC [Phytophthora palmivora]